MLWGHTLSLKLFSQFATTWLQDEEILSVNIGFIEHRPLLTFAFAVHLHWAVEADLFNCASNIPRNWAVAKNLTTNGLFVAVNIYPSAAHFLFVSPPNGGIIVLVRSASSGKGRKFLILSSCLLRQHSHKTIFDQHVWEEFPKVN